MDTIQVYSEITKGQMRAIPDGDTRQTFGLAFRVLKGLLCEIPFKKLNKTHCARRGYTKNCKTTRRRTDGFSLDRRGGVCIHDHVWP